MSLTLLYLTVHISACGRQSRCLNLLACLFGLPDCLLDRTVLTPLSASAPCRLLALSANLTSPHIILLVPRLQIPGPVPNPRGTAFTTTTPITPPSPSEPEVSSVVSSSSLIALAPSICRKHFSARLCGAHGAMQTKGAPLSSRSSPASRARMELSRP